MLGRSKSLFFRLRGRW